MLIDYPRNYTTCDDPRAAFKAFVAAVPTEPVTGFGVGISTHVKNADGTPGQLLDVYFPFGVNNVSDEKYAGGSAAILANALDHTGGTAVYFPDREKLQAVFNGFAAFLKDDRSLHPNIAAIEQVLADVHYDVKDPGFGRVYSAVVCFIGKLDDPTHKVFADDDTEQATNLVPDATVADLWHRLTQLSYCKVLPNDIKLDGIFTTLPNLAWTSAGAMLPSYANKHRLALKRAAVTWLGTDRFPRYGDYVEPGLIGVRIADGARVRLGAHLAPGTTVMHEGFVNFNAGTKGKAMVEGRISQGVIIGNGTDIGGGASTMGTLSGGNDIKVSMGDDCLLEAESGFGIPGGDRVRVEAGLYIKGTTPVWIDISDVAWAGNNVVDRQLVTGHEKELAASKIPLGESSIEFDGTLTVKAAELAFISDAIFRRNARNGRVEVLPRGSNIWGELKPELHAN